MNDDTYTDERNPELTSLFNDIFEPACKLFKIARRSVPEIHKTKVVHLEATGQAIIIINLRRGERARCVLANGQNILELGTAPIEDAYYDVLTEFVDFGVHHMLRAKKVAQANRDGSLPFVVAIFVGERRIRLLAFLGGNVLAGVPLFELTDAATERAPVLN